MKVCTAIVATALVVSSTIAAEPTHVRSGESPQRRLKEQATTTWVDALTPIANADKFHMKPVRAIHARVQGDSPAWDADKSMFTSAYGANFAEKFRASLDTVNTASVEGALMYVQAEGINYAARAEADKCVRKNKMKNVVFYDIVFAQPNETLALYEKDEFCVDGGVEFNGSVADGAWQASIPFWLKPQDRAENAKRATAMLTTYATMLTAKASTQVSTDDINRMTAVPTVEALAAANPACYQNVKTCSGTYGCKRALYSQLCTECSATDTGCTKAVSGFTFPTLTKAVSATGSAGNKDATATSTSSPTTTTTPTPTTAATPTPTAATPAPTSSASTIRASLMGLATVAVLALSSVMLG
ncbi:hypothetical protein PybrP1_010915 [[Pythium] brassicae (nom. inval.)]|nr:hypothetical protein PybrP1_010915 [[Pythium] brassicae (nom. inval.)]